MVSRYPQILEAARAAGGRAVDSPQSAGGISYTIRAALDALPPVSGEDFLFFAVADQPWLEADTLLRLVDAARPGVPGGTAAFGEQVGSPTFFSGALLPKLYALTGDQGGRPILRELGSACVKVQAGSLRELEDLDTPPERGEILSFVFTTGSGFLSHQIQVDAFCHGKDFIVCLCIAPAANCGQQIHVRSTPFCFRIKSM